MTNEKELQMENERKVARIADESVDVIKALLKGEIVEGATVKLQGFTGIEFLAQNFENVNKIDGLSKCYSVDYHSVLAGVKFSMCQNFNKNERDAWDDFESDIVHAYYKKNPVEIKRENGVVKVYSDYKLAIYNDKL